MLKKRGPYTFEKANFNDWETGLVEIGTLAITFCISGELIDHPALPARLHSIDMTYLNQKIASSYSQLYAASEPVLNYQSQSVAGGLVYIPQFVPRMICIAHLNEIIILFDTESGPFSGDAQSLLWSVTYCNEEITEVRWETC